jgi:resuscitation-promoting factor RpfA
MDKMERTMSATTEEDKHFSDSMLQWMAEGDRLHEDPKHGGFLIEGTARRSWKFWLAAPWAVALVIGGRFVVQHLGSNQAVAVEVAAPAVPVPAAAPVSQPVAAAPAVAPPTAPPSPVAVASAPAPAVAEALPAAVQTGRDDEPSAAKPAAAAVEKLPAVASLSAATTIEVAPAPAPAPAAAAPPVPAAAPPAAEPATAAAPAAVTATEDFETLLGRCREATSRGRWGAARAACTAAQQERPDSADVLTRLAEIALNRGQGRAALRLATSALAADPAFADAYVIVGSVQQNENRNNEARAAYNKYLQLAPSGRFASDLRAILTTL